MQSRHEHIDKIYGSNQTDILRRYTLIRLFPPKGHFAYVTQFHRTRSQQKQANPSCSGTVYINRQEERDQDQNHTTRHDVPPNAPLPLHLQLCFFRVVGHLHTQRSAPRRGPTCAAPGPFRRDLQSVVDGDADVRSSRDPALAGGPCACAPGYDGHAGC